MRRAIGLTGVLFVLLAMPVATAAAKDRIYWGGSGKISYANLDGSGGGDLEVGTARVDQPRGLAIDSEAGTIYWPNRSPPYGISYARLDSSGGGDLPIEGPPINWPTGVAIDPSEQRLYWGNYQGGATERISFWDLDDEIGGSVITAGATAQNVQGVALDLAAGRIYWANESFYISYAELDGSGGDDVNITGSTSGDSAGVAIDPAGDRIFWPSHKGFSPYASVLSYAALDNSGATDLNIPEATFNFPEGVAIDVEEDRIYWANTDAFGGSGSIAYANLDGSGAGVLPRAGATLSPPTYPVIQKAPVMTLPPQIVRMVIGSPLLACTQGGWAPDVREAHFYREPERIDVQWLRNGVEIPGQTGELFAPDVSQGGSFSCRVTAVNAAGSRSLTTDPVDYPEPPQSAPGQKGVASAARVAIVKRGRALLKMRCGGPADCAGTAKLAARLHRKAGTAGRSASVLRPPKAIGEASFAIPLGETGVVRVKLSRKAKRALRRAPKRRMRASLSGLGVAERSVLLKLARRR